MRIVRALVFLASAAAAARFGRASDWTAASPPAVVSEIAVDRSSPSGPVYAVTSDGTYRSGDGGRSWRLLPGSPTSSVVAALALDPLDPRRIMGVGCGARESTDGGETWADASAGLPAGCSLTSLVPDPKGVAAFLAGGDGGVFLAGFGPAGRVWASISDGNFSVVAALTTETTPDGTRIIWAAAPDGALFANSAGTWFEQFPVPASPRSLSTCCDGLIAATDRGAFRLNAGRWELLAEALAGFGVNDFASGSLAYAATDRGIFRSSSFFNTWSPLSSGLPEGVPVRRIVSDGPGARVFALAGGTVYRFDYPPATLRLLDPDARIPANGWPFTIAIAPPQPFAFDLVWRSSDPSVIASGRVFVFPLAPTAGWWISPLAASAAPVTVTFSTEPDFGIGSVSIALPVLNPAPLLWFMDPVSAPAGVPATVVRVSGAGFPPYSYVPGSTIHWNGSPRPTRRLSLPCSEICLEVLEADISAADLATPGIARVTIVNPPPGGGESAPLEFHIIAFPFRTPTPCASCRRPSPRAVPPRAESFEPSNASTPGAGWQVRVKS